MLRPQDVPGSRKAVFPRVIEPQLATLTKEAPVGDEWLHEMKFDGYRMLCRINGKHVDLVSRNEKSWTKRLEYLAHEAHRLKVQQAILDGEVVALEPNGVSSFQALQNVFSENRTHELIYYAFDLLYLNGYDLRPGTLESRKHLLAQLIGQGIGPFRFSEHIEGNGPAFFRQACQARLEGIISKRRDRPYSGGRSYDWIKVKCVQNEEFVIGGYTDPAGSRTSFGALLVGYYDSDGRLRYAGKVGTGFTNRTLIELLKRLEPLARKESPFVDLTRKVGVARSAHWVKPSLVGQIEFTEWTRDNRLRHPSFQGLREDKPAKDVVRDVPKPVAAVVKASDKRKKPPAH